MYWFQWLSLFALFVCLLSCAYHFYMIVRLGNPPEYARRAGHVGRAVRYSFTGAMSPKVKESAYLHLPTYIAGIFYHTGTFLSIILFFLSMFNIWVHGWMKWAIIAFLLVSVFCGMGILIKRMIKNELRSLSNPDDYISNILVTAFQFITALLLFDPVFGPAYYIIASMLLLYFPLGKLKHAVYFFAARYHLGYFYGWRGIWPPKPIKK